MLETHMPEKNKKTAIITGGAGGIGSAVAQKLLQRDYALILTSRSIESLNRTAKELGGGGAVKCIPADAGDPQQCIDIIAQAKKFTGRIDVLVNAAGHAPMIPNTQVTPQQWRQIIDGNLTSVFFMTQAIWPVFRRQFEQSRTAGGAGTGGVIVNISSVAARDPFPGLGVYAAAKAGVNMLTLSAAREGAAIGIRVVGIGFGAVETKMLRALPVADKIPLEDILSPQEAADAVLAAIDGGLTFANGETVYIHRGVY
jgi:NAD(P)-dependent dehydrogenase (short-subunit alcohol dehydrogenase family)